jgi:hypothetical protein
MRRPLVGSVMAGTGGLRKFCLAAEGSGKSGGYRICYVLIRTDLVLLVTLFSKTDQANLSPVQRNDFKRVIDTARTIPWQ